MADPNIAFNSDQKIEVENQTTNGCEQTLMTIDQTDSDDTTASIRSRIKDSTSPVRHLYEYHQRRRHKQRARKIMMHDLSSSFMFGDAVPCLSNENNGIADSMLKLHLTDDNVHELYLGESTAVQDSQPHNMPVSITSSLIRHVPARNDEGLPTDRFANTNAIPGDETAVLVPTDCSAVKKSAHISSPAEYFHHYDYSVNTLETNSNQQTDEETEIYADRNCPNSPVISQSFTIDEGETSISAGNATISIKMDDRSNPAHITYTIDQPNPTTTPQSTCSQATDSGRNAETSPTDVNQSTACNAPLLNLLVSKIPEVVDNDSESSEDSID